MKKFLILAFIVTALVAVHFASSTAFAATQEDLVRDGMCQSGQNANCVGVYCDPAAPIEEGKTPKECAETSRQHCQNEDCNLVNQYLNPFIKVLSLMVGVAVTIGIIIGGIQYAGSAGDPGKVTAAKHRIRNSIVALILFFFLYALLRFLMPGESFIRG